MRITTHKYGWNLPPTPSHPDILLHIMVTLPSHTNWGGGWSSYSSQQISGDHNTAKCVYADFLPVITDMFQEKKLSQEPDQYLPIQGSQYRGKVPMRATMNPIYPFTAPEDHEYMYNNRLPCLCWNNISPRDRYLCNHIPLI